MSAHTPGPWTAFMQKSRDGRSLGWIINTFSGRGGRIGWASRAYADANLAAPDSEEDTSNARLIAAAPELLAALKQVHACATMRDDGTCEGCLVSEAIQKAEGQS